MVTVRFQVLEDGKTLSLTVHGHANSANVGKDILCASASILAYTAAQVVKTMGERDELRKKPTLRLEEGDACIVVKPRRGHYAEALHAFSVIQTGYGLLEANYPAFFHLIKFGEAE